MGVLAQIGLKDYIYAAVIVALLAFFGWYTFHERAIGAANIARADAATAAVQHERVAVAEAKSTAVEDKINETFDTAVSAPLHTPAPVVRVCVAPHSRNMPAARAVELKADGPPIIGSQNPSGPDIGKPLVTIGRDDDALITALQAEVQRLRTLMSAGK